MDSLRNKAALITGGSSGIGRATALARHGVRVALAARHRGALEQVQQEIQRQGGSAVCIPTDVTDAEQVRHAVDATIEAFGQLDLLLCSAGLSMRAYFDTSRLEALERVMRVNFFGTLYATHFALPHVKKTRGSLVAISSLAGKRGIPSYAVYGASKFAVSGLYEALRMELARDGVHVGVVAPAFVDTPLRENVLGADGEPWPVPPPPPFRVWPVEKCVERIVHLIVQRRRQALLPWFAGPLILADAVLGQAPGDRLLAWKFPRG
jgi:dehydrogenase/reductase SDR family member 7B